MRSGERRVCRFSHGFLVAVFAWTAGSKLAHARTFRAFLLKTGMIAPPMIPYVAITAPLIELAIAALLAVRPRMLAPLTAALFLSLTFAFVHGFLLWAGEVVPCGCAGIALSRGGAAEHAAILLVSLAMAAAAAHLMQSREATQPPADPDIASTDITALRTP